MSITVMLFLSYPSSVTVVLGGLVNTYSVVKKFSDMGGVGLIVSKLGHQFTVPIVDEF